jgi:hypothetical protein
VTAADFEDVFFELLYVGYIEVVGVDADDELLYAITDKGIDVFEVLTAWAR